MKQDENKIRIAFYGLFGILGILILLTPHLVAGHIFFMEENYAQSLALFIDILVGYLFYRFYKKKMKNLHYEKMQTEKRLDSSYRYIGKINNIVDIFKSFSSVFSLKQKDEAKDKDIFNPLLQHMLVSIAKADRGFLRFVNAENGKTISEFFFSKSGEVFSVKLSNVAIIEGRIENVNSDDTGIVESDYRKNNVRCVLYFSKNDEIVDYAVLKSLLTQVHLLFIALHANYSIGTMK